MNYFYYNFEYNTRRGTLVKDLHKDSSKPFLCVSQKSKKTDLKRHEVCFLSQSLQ